MIDAILLFLTLLAFLGSPTRLSPHSIKATSLASLPALTVGSRPETADAIWVAATAGLERRQWPAYSRAEVAVEHWQTAQTALVEWQPRGSMSAEDRVRELAQVWPRTLTVRASAPTYCVTPYMPNTPARTMMPLGLHG